MQMSTKSNLILFYSRSSIHFFNNNLKEVYRVIGNFPIFFSQDLNIYNIQNMMCDIIHLVPCVDRLIYPKVKSRQ